MRDTSRTAVLLATLLLAAGAAGASAHTLPAERLIESIVLAAAGMSLDQAVEMAEKRFRARVVRADVREEQGRKVYVLRLLNESGRVWTVRVDAESGAIR